MSRASGIACMVLAAGLGTRMKSAVPKVLHPIYGRPMLQYCLDTIAALKPERCVVVVNSRSEDIEAAVSTKMSVSYALQKEQKGTAHALLAGLDGLKGFKGTVLVTNGDTPLITAKTLRNFLGLHRKHSNSLSVLSFHAEDPTDYGRVLRGQDRKAVAIVEEKDADENMRMVTEVNSGLYAMEPDALPLLKEIKLNPIKKEYYLTDIVAITRDKGLRMDAYGIGMEDEFLGINSREDLANAHEYVRAHKVRALMEKGVTFIDPYTAYIAPDVEIGPDSVIYPNVFIHGPSRIGRDVTIMPNVRIFESTIKQSAVIKDSCVIERSTIGKAAQVGPFARLRMNAELGADASVGNFVEVKKSTIGAGTKAQHLAYLGDATIGKKVNIGAGTITCNYDGRKKHPTVIGDGVFIGSDSQLVAPVRVNRDAYVAAGSTITMDVPEGALALSRIKQRVIAGYAKRRKKDK